MEAKMIMDTPLPTPFSVMRSPIQTRKAVPAVHTMPMVAYTYQAVLVTTPEPMPTTMPMLCTRARPMPVYRVIYSIFCRPSSSLAMRSRLGMAMVNS